MIWSKTRQQLESFLCPELVGRVAYIASGYRYLPDKPTHCNITVDQKEVFRLQDTTLIKWHLTEQELKTKLVAKVSLNLEDIEAVRKEHNSQIPEDRLVVIARNNKATFYAKAIVKAETSLVRLDFQKAGHIFLSEPIEKSLLSDDIILNVLALVDRRVGKKRLHSLEYAMQLKHPVVQYFYALRLGLTS